MPTLCIITQSLPGFDNVTLLPLFHFDQLPCVCTGAINLTVATLLQIAHFVYFPLSQMNSPRYTFPIEKYALKPILLVVHYTMQSRSREAVHSQLLCIYRIKVHRAATPE